MAERHIKASRCTATSRSTGLQCARPANLGANVCRFHGGSAPQVKASAALRLAALVDPAIGVLVKAMKHKDIRAALNAAQDVLDRNNLSGKTKIEVSGSEALVEALKGKRAKRAPADQPEGIAE